jgi:hypothetical protein
MSSTARETGQPIAVDDIRPCGQLMAFKRPDGRVIVRQQPCDWKGCPTCGPRLRQQWADQWAHAMGNQGIYRLEVDDGEPAKLRRRKVMARHELSHIPLPEGRRALYTTAPLDGASICEDVPHALSRDFAQMPNDSRRRFLSEGWRQIVADAETEAAAAREPWEYLGRVGRSIEQVEMAARHLGKLVDRTGERVVAEVMTTEELVRFLHLIRCRGPWQRWGEDAPKVKRRRAA